jgi:hypothetical protein
MNINSERAKAIDAYIATHSDAEMGRWPLEIGGQKMILPFYRFPIKELLRYNVTNGRLAMDVREWEKLNGRRLDATTEEDSTIIRQMLLNLGKSETSLLKEDIHKKNQMEPGVITHDGFVINGNRRMAILEELNREEPTGKWSFLEAVRLPSTITEKDVWKIEAGLQLSKDKIAEYHPVNELLKIKQGIDAKLSIEEIAAAMYGRTTDEIKESLARLQLLDNFLEFFGQPGNYGLIRTFGLHEYFIDLQKYVMTAWDRRGLTSRKRKEELIYAFALLGAGIRIQSLKTGKGKDKGITHWDIRKLGKIFADMDAKEAYTQNLKKSSKKPLEVKATTLIEDFRTAEDILGMKEQRDQPVRLIEKAIKALESVDRTNKHFREIRVKNAIDRLSSIVQEIKKDLTG